MTTTRKENIPEDRPKERGAAPERERDKVRVPAEPVEQRPGEPPIGNGGANEPAAFPPHN
jgi:hypothetical protein